MTGTKITTKLTLPKGYTHGTRMGYKWGCRCDACTECHRDYQERVKARWRT